MSDFRLKSVSNGMYGIAASGSSLLRTAPEPRNSLGEWIQSVAQTGLNVAQTVIPGGELLDSNNMSDLLNMQIQIQQQMQVVSMISNVEKSKHETEMAPIRNMRVG